MSVAPVILKQYIKKCYGDLIAPHGIKTMGLLYQTCYRLIQMYISIRSVYN